MVVIDTTVSGDVREHHFRCCAGHQFSIFAKDDLEIAPMLSICVVSGCYVIGDNAAQASTNATDLLTH